MRRRVFAVEYEQMAKVSDTLTIQIQFLDSCAACRRQADEIKVIGTPDKMREPVVFSRMKKQNLSSGCWIERMRLVGFGTVATLASQSQIIFGTFAALAFR